MLNERARTLLKALIERYVADGQPVGSRALSKHAGLDLSPASIRNVMADLEEMGFVASPHTSAGRVPTAKGYRFFVDCLLTVRPLDMAQIHQLEGRLLPDNLHTLLSSASNLLSGLTHFAGVVVTPRRRSPAFRQVEFLKLSDTRILLIIVTPDGDVQNRVLFSEHSYSPSDLTQAANFLNQNYAGCTLEQIRDRLQGELTRLHRDMTGLLTAALEASTRALTDPREECVISGERNLLRVEDFSEDMSQLRKLFDLFEERTQLLQLLDLSNRAQGVQIFIGSESGIVPLDECSVVTAPYEVDGEVMGTVGVIGPTRMAYERVIPIVDITAKLLSSALSH